MQLGEDIIVQAKPVSIWKRPSTYAVLMVGFLVLKNQKKIFSKL